MGVNAIFRQFTAVLQSFCYDFRIISEQKEYSENLHGACRMTYNKFKFRNS